MEKPNWRKRADRIRGLGDRVEMVAQPVAKFIDKVLNTNIQGCSSCKKRRDALNKSFPSK